MGKFLSYVRRMIIFICIQKIPFSYPSTFIDNQFRKFFFQYNISSSPFLPFSDDEKQFILMRNKLLGQPTHRQTQVAMNAATANIDNDQTDEQPIEPKDAIMKTKQKPKIRENKLI